MAKGFRRFRKDAPPASEVVRRSLIAAGWVRLNDRSAYEVPPGMIWPLPGGNLSCRILGVPSARLLEVGIPADQAGLPQLLAEDARRTKVLGALRENLAYRIGGSWHCAECQLPGLSGSNVQRLETWAFLEAAARPWSIIRTHLENGSAMTIEISNSDRQKVTPTGRAGSPSVDSCWEQLMAGPVDHWTTGFGYGDEYCISGIHGSSLVRVATRPAGSGKRNPGHQLILTPLGVALAAGLRGRVNRQAESEIHHDAPFQELVKVVWEMRDPARRMLLHILSATTPENPANGPCSYLDDSWLLAALLGAKTRTMTEKNRIDLRKRRAQAAAEALEAVASSRLEGFVCRTLKPLLPTKAAVTLQTKNKGSNKPVIHGCMLPQETTPIPAGHTTGSLRKDIRVLTERHLETDAKTSETHWIRIFWERLSKAIIWLITPLRTKDLERNIRTLPAPAPTTHSTASVVGWSDSGTSEPLGGQNPGKNEKRLWEKKLPFEPETIFNQKDAETPDPKTGRNQEEYNLPPEPSATIIRSEERHSNSTSESLPHQDVHCAEPTSSSPSGERKESPLESKGSPAQMESETLEPAGERNPGHGGLTSDVDATTIFPDEQPSPSSRGFQPRQGVIYAEPGSCKPSGDRYELPLGSRREVPAEEMAALGQFLATHPDLERRFSSDALGRILAYLPSNEKHPISAGQLISLLTATASATLTKAHLEKLLRIIDTTPDDLIPNKSHHLASAIESEMVRTIWLGWSRRSFAMKDWARFSGRDPYRVAAGMAWRRKANPEIRSIEAAAMAFADWWTLSNVDSRIERPSASDRELHPLVRLVDALRGAGGPSDCGWAMWELSGPNEFGRHGPRADRCWQRLQMDPTQILGSLPRPAASIGLANGPETTAC